ncbi:MAG: hypothetical protein HF978_04065 [Desulfobacteraceae bacterium]|nr:hypothetical protein [Desulfobacteraceae bacterium]MBC2754704.1 hypothetical protein [Desulfobacteraceae bacterium]
MNKLTILIIMVISFGLIATQAMAADDLLTSDFFYGETIDTTVEVIKAADLQERANVTTQSIVLSESEFFYGETIDNAVEVINADALKEETAVATPSNDLLTPEIFYGYKDVILVTDKCANC